MRNNALLVAVAVHTVAVPVMVFFPQYAPVGAVFAALILLWFFSILYNGDGDMSTKNYPARMVYLEVLSSHVR